MYTKLIQSGSINEVFQYSKTPYAKRQNTTGKTNRAKRSISKRHFKRRTDNIQRLRSNFRRLIWANLSGSTPPYLVTFTMLQVLSYEASSSIFSAFLAVLKRRTRKKIRYIAVPEFQKRGAVHFHCLFWDQNELCKQEKTTRYIQRLWQRGFVDCVSTDGSDRLGSYLAKYMSKAMQDDRLLRKKAYFTSHNILRPVSYASETLDSFLDEVIHRSDLVYTREYESQWLGRSNYYKYKSNVTYAGKDKNQGDNS